MSAQELVTKWSGWDIAPDGQMSFRGREWFRVYGTDGKPTGDIVRYRAGVDAIIPELRKDESNDALLPPIFRVSAWKLRLSAAMLRSTILFLTTR